MAFIEIIFYVFSSILVLTSLGVILFKNPVYSAISLILSFITSAALWLLLQAEFLAIVLILVYVGAVMVLFLFVVMMLNVAQQKNQWFEATSGYSHMPIGLIRPTVIFFD